jgi:hypothetical protein
MIQNEPTYRLFRSDLENPTREQAADAFAATNALPVPSVEPVDISNAVLFPPRTRPGTSPGLPSRWTPGTRSSKAERTPRWEGWVARRVILRIYWLKPRLANPAAISQEVRLLVRGPAESFTESCP